MMMVLKGNRILVDLACRFRRCWPKAQHPSRGAAKAQLRSLERRGLVRDPRTAHIYPCSNCGAWHVGHSLLEGVKDELSD